jgi:phospholipid/cholesterol/gamma-HCH transport system substrate-binding protein
MSVRRKTRRRRRIDRRLQVLLRGTTMLVILGVVGWLALSLYGGVPGRDYRMISVTVPSVGNLIQHDPVRMAGVRIGQVAGTAARRDGTVELRLQLDPGTHVQSNSTVAIRANGLLGARYVELLPGHGTTELPDGASLTAGSASLTYGVPEALDTFDAETRGALGDLVGQLGAGLAGRGLALNDAIAASAPATTAFQRLASGLLDSRTRLGRLLPAARGATAALDAARDDLAASARPLAQSLAPIVQERAAVDRALRAAPPALRNATTGLSDGERLLAATGSLARAAHRALPPAPLGLRRTASLLRTSVTPLRRTRPLLIDLRAAVPPTLRVTNALNPVLKPLYDALNGALPIIDAVGRYGCNIVNLGATWRSMTGSGGTGEGPAGPAMQFRLQVVPSVPAETLGTPDATGLLRREGDGAPCTRLASPYPAIELHPPAR